MVAQAIDGEGTGAIRGRSEHDEVDTGRGLGRALDEEEPGITSRQSLQPCPLRLPGNVSLPLPSLGPIPAWWGRAWQPVDRSATSRNEFATWTPGAG